jgi:hypothetical protein|tara:strand:+ start:416 stop:1009 length:594 start_codon:yes stop_codon:yes gene_type:complete
MASSSKQKTDEEIAKELADARKVMLTSAGGLGSGMYSIGDGQSSYGDIAQGKEYIVRKDGDREYIDIGGARAYWDEDKKRWAGSGFDSAGGNHRAAHFNTTDVAKQSSGGKGGKGGKGGGGKPPKDEVTYPGGQGPTVQTTPLSAFQVGPGWSNWTPVGNGGSANPLWDQYDPWMPDPAHGIWTNPGIINTNPRVLI